MSVSDKDGLYANLELEGVGGVRVSEDDEVRVGKNDVSCCACVWQCCRVKADGTTDTKFQSWESVRAGPICGNSTIYKLRRICSPLCFSVETLFASPWKRRGVQPRSRLACKLRARDNCLKRCLHHQHETDLRQVSPQNATV